MDNALPTNCHCNQNQQQHRTSKDENEVRLKPAIDNISSNNLKIVWDPENQIQTSTQIIFCIPFLLFPLFFTWEFHSKKWIKDS